MKVRPVSRTINSPTFSSRTALWIVLVSFGLAAGSSAHSQTTASLNNEEASPARETRGLVRSASRIEYRSDLVAPVARTPFLEGMAFKKGDLLLDFDCKRQRAELKVTKARANAAHIDYKSKKRLLAHKAIGRDEVQLAAAKAAEASAEVGVLKTRGESCAFKAPFAGRVVELNAHEHELPPSDKPLLVIIKDSVLELEMVVPSHWLNWMEKGKSFDFKIDETGETVSAKIERIGAEVDPVSQTIKIIGVLDNQGKRVLAGMSGNAEFGASE